MSETPFSVTMCDLPSCDKQDLSSHLFLGVCVVGDVDKLANFWGIYLLVFPVETNTSYRGHNNVYGLVDSNL